MPIVRDLKIDPVTGDLARDPVTGDLVLVADEEAIAQDARLRCKFVRGEQFDEISAGVPYHELVFVKSPNLAAVREAFRAEIAAAQGISGVPLVDLEYAGDRLARVSFKASGDASVLADSIEVAP